jgi:hypothetical protein
VCLAILALVSFGQAPPHQYTEYPETAGKTRQFQWKQLPSWLSFDWELRARVEGNTAYNGVSSDGEAYGLTRVRGGMHIDPAAFLSLHLQFQDTHAPGLTSQLVANNMHDTFDLREGYAELHKDAWKAFLGRQELKFGSERLIGVSDFTNNSRTFDGFDLRMGKKNKVDIFSTSVVITHPTSLDTHGAGLTFHGVYGRFDGLSPRTSLQPFVLIKALPHLQSSRGRRGDELATTFGAEVQGNVKDIWEYDVIGALQRGSFADDPIQSDAVVVKVFYSLPNLRLAPRIGGEFDRASGNGSSTGSTVGTFDQQYPSNHNAFGLGDLFGFQNIREARLNLDLAPAKNLTLLVQAESLQLASVHDALYDSAGSAIAGAPSAGFASDHIGYGVDVSAKYVFHKALVWNVGIARLQGGSVMRSSHLADGQTYGYLSATFRFGLQH